MTSDNPKGYDEPGLLWSVARLRGELGDPNLRIIDVRPGERYTMGHIPGALHFHIYAMNCDDTDEKPLNSFTRMLAHLLGYHGVNRDNRVVFCGEIAGMTAARGFWFLELLGHDKVHVLDGGLTAWSKAGLPLTRDAEVPTPTPVSFDVRRDRLATYEDVLDAIGDPERVILDTRNQREWTGQEVRARRGGAIPGAVHQDWVAHLTPEGCLKPAQELRKGFEAVGATPDKEIIPYCQTGYRSAHAYLALRLLGYPRVRNYLGSWNEWGNSDELPIVVPEA